MDIDFLKRPQRFPRVVWGTAALAAVVPLVWFAIACARGERRAFAARPVSAVHKLFENDCQQCHTQWAPAERLFTFDSTVHSVSNDQCLSCHRSQAHHVNQIPAHRDISCAACHREHRESASPVQVADHICVECHRDLKTTDGPSRSFATDLRHFDESPAEGAHPQFKLHELLRTGTDKTVPPTTSEGARAQSAFRLLAYFQRPTDSAPRWQDAARVQFNHAKHLVARYDEHGKLIAGVRDQHGQMVDLSQNCQTCHQPDSEHRYMLPINYETHCRNCHPLTFDIERFPGRVAPHQEPALVRGFLTDLYAWGKSPAADEKAQDEADDSWLPGPPPREALSGDLLETVRNQVDRAEHHLLGHEAKGGCRLCHEVGQQSGESLWTITPTRIPDRWLPHSQFNHDSHRLLNCLECHTDTLQSQSTGDVLLPAIDLCRKCHGNDTGHGTLAHARLDQARGGCIECHTYHDRTGESLNGQRDTALDLRAAKPSP